MNSLIVSQIVPIAVMIGIVYLIIFRPQQQQKKKHEEAILGIKKGDEIVTLGGIIGDVIHIKALGTDGAPTLDDRLTVRSGESRLVIERGRVARVGPGAAAGQPTPPAKASASTSTT
jgi:preprotein translocase subunit YajC